MSITGTLRTETIHWCATKAAQQGRRLGRATYLEAEADTDANQQRKQHEGPHVLACFLKVALLSQVAHLTVGVKR